LTFPASRCFDTLFELQGHGNKPVQSTEYDVNRVLDPVYSTLTINK